MTGIYTIRIAHYYYFGQSVSIPKRVKSHLLYLRKGIHANQKMQNIFNKYGEDQFTWTKDIDCPPQDMNRWESYMIAHFFDDPLNMNLINGQAKPGGVYKPAHGRDFAFISWEGRLTLYNRHRDAADDIGVSRGTVSNWLLGTRSCSKGIIYYIGKKKMEKFTEHVGMINRIKDALDSEGDQVRIATVGLEVVDLLLRKNTDYGGSAYQRPILAPHLDPMTAMECRMSDKIARLITLCEKPRGAELVDETLEDTYRDLIGYMILYIAFKGA